MILSRFYLLFLCYNISWVFCMILMVSGRCDIVAFYTPWFMNRYKEGYVDVRNPFYKRLVSRIYFKDVDLIMFCTKNPLPIIPYLKEMGFNIEEFGINSIIVKGHPTWLGGPYADSINESIKSIIDIVIEKEKNFDLSRFRDHVAATTACKMSIKANDKITLEEMTRLLEDLRKCKNPFNCPHGRPTIISMSKYEIDKRFKRIV